MSTLSDSVILSVSVDHKSSEAAYMQIFSQLRASILSGRLSPGQRLPSTRKLAEELGLSRTTLVAAYDHLVSEGYIEPRRGSGAYVADYSPEQLLSVTDKKSAPTKRAPPTASPEPVLLFTPGIREEALFPFANWARLLQKHWREPAPGLLSQPEPAGNWNLRSAIAEHLRIWRGLLCGPEQVFITSGGGDAADLVLRCITVPGDRIFLEDPGYVGSRSVAAERGLSVQYCAVDGEGMKVPEYREPSSLTQISFVTPSRQFPLGITMSLSRRVALIDWAVRNDGWVIEDDYDSEFRYSGRPLAAMMSLDETGRVIYLGSFSNIMFKGLRLGFAVVPEQLIEPVTKNLNKRGSSASTIAQPALGEFIASGQFATHARRLRRLYGRRHKVMVAGLETRCENLLEAVDTPCGMSIVAYLHEALRARMTDSEAVARLKQNELACLPLSSFYANHPPLHGLILGFSGFGEDVIEAGLASLAQALRF